LYEDIARLLTALLTGSKKDSDDKNFPTFSKPTTPSLCAPKLPLRQGTAGRDARSATLLVGSAPSTRAAE